MTLVKKAPKATSAKSPTPPSIKNAGFTLEFRSIPSVGRFHILSNHAGEIARFKATSFDKDSVTMFLQSAITDYMKLVEIHTKWLDTQPEYALSKKASTLVEALIEAARDHAFAEEGASSDSIYTADCKMQKSYGKLHTFIAELEHLSVPAMQLALESIVLLESQMPDSAAKSSALGYFSGVKEKLIVALGLPDVKL